MVRPQTRQLSLERFEDRNLPAPLNFTLTATEDLFISGTVTVDLEIVATAPNTFTITDNGVDVLTDLVVPGNISVTLNGNDDVVLLDTAAGFSGSFSLNAGGQTTLDVFGLNPGSTVGGNLTLTNVEITDVADAAIGGNVSINSAAPNPLNSYIFNGTAIGGSFFFTAGNNTFNSILIDTSAVGGNVNVTAGNTLANTIAILNSAVGGSYTYTGGSGTDSNIFGTTVIGGSVNSNLGPSVFGGGGGNSFVFVDSVIGLSLTVRSGLSLAGDTDNIDITSGTIGGSASFILGEGANTLNFGAMFGSTSSSFSYQGGSGIDNITYAPAGGSRARFTATLGAGNDLVTFGGGAANPSSAYIDFGAGVDSVAGPLNFPFTFINLP